MNLKVLLYTYFLILTFTIANARNSTHKSTKSSHISTLNDQANKSHPDAFLSESAKIVISKFYDNYCKIYENPTREALIDIFADELILITINGEILNSKEDVIKLFLDSFPDTFIHCEYKQLFLSGTDEFPFVITEIRSYSHKKELRSSHIIITQLQKTQSENYEIIALSYQISKMQDGVIDEYVSHKKSKSSKQQTIRAELRDSGGLSTSEIYNISDNHTTMNYPIEFISKYIHSKYNFSTKNPELSKNHQSIKSEMDDTEDFSLVTVTNSSNLATDTSADDKSSISLLQYSPINTMNITDETLQNQPFAILKQDKNPTTNMSNDKKYNNNKTTDLPSLDSLDNEEEYYYYYDENSSSNNN